MINMSNSDHADARSDTRRKYADTEIRPEDRQNPTPGQTGLRLIHTWICIVLLFVNYFLAQYDKFILSYFQADVIKTLDLYVDLSMKSNFQGRAPAKFVQGPQANMACSLDMQQESFTL